MSDLSDHRPLLEEPVAATAEPAEALPPAVPGVTAPPRENLWRALNWRSLALDLFLIALIVIGVYFRFNWVNWNQDASLHPDEYGLTNTLTHLALPKSLDDYFNTRLSPLSPYQKYDAFGQPNGDGPDNGMRWGQWPQIIIRATAEICTTVPRLLSGPDAKLTDYTQYSDLRILGRRLSALMDTFSLLLIFLIGQRLYNRRVGLLAAALSALAVLSIQASHFMTVDNYGVVFTLLTVYAAVRVAQAKPTRSGKPDWWGYAFFGVAFGMTIASRINLLPLAGLILLAAWIASADAWSRQDFSNLFDIGVRLAIAGAAAFITFRVTHPMAFRAETGDTAVWTLNPNPDWMRNMAVAQVESSGESSGGPPGEQWANRPVLIFPFTNMVLWGLGLPLGLMAWAGVGWVAWRLLRSNDDEWKVHLIPFVWTVGYFLFMGTRWIKSVRYFLPIYPLLALFAAWALVALWNKAAERRPKDEGEGMTANNFQPLAFILHTLAAVLFAVVTLGTLAWAWGYTGIYRQDNTRIQASRWIYQNMPAPVNVHLQTATGTYTEPLGAYGDVQVTGDAPYRLQFQSHVTGTVIGFTVGYARNAIAPQTAGLLHVALAADPEGQQPLAQADVPVAPVGTDPRGMSVSMALGPAELVKDRVYYLLLTVPAGTSVVATGSAMSCENWDEWLPVSIDGHDASLYHGVSMEIRGYDDERKRQMILDNLAQVDYIILPSQRAIWSASRLPATYPMTLEYYRALFDGRLGFEQVDVSPFQAPLTFGPLQISDVGGSVAWGRAPTLPLFNDNPLSAEEAFSIYDHAPVWIFRKRADFDLEKARQILSTVDLAKVVNQGPREATLAPTLLMLPPDRLAQQRAGGTWRDMFDPAGLLNANQPLGVLAWYLAVLILGWLAFPLTYLALGGLPDRGYPLAKTVALLVVAWLVWLAGSFRILPFTQATIALGVLLLAVISGVIYFFRRQEINHYLRSHWRHILAVETLFIVLFGFDLLIRLGNPDLWHPNFGGEKPMVFSYFNAVLKSTYFPPYDPWLAGGYINYYYYGFVIVGVLTKLLGIVPAFAYNLILPTLFALLGSGAFCVAYNLVRAVGEKQKAQAAAEARAKVEEEKPATDVESQAAEVGRQKTEVGSQNVEVAVEVASVNEAVESVSVSQSPNLSGAQSPDASIAQSEIQNPKSQIEDPKFKIFNPYLAGLAAVLLVVVLGNLAQVGVLAKGLQATGGHPMQSLDDVSLPAIGEGAWRVLSGQADISLGTGSWYWDATRIVAAATQGQEITEFPFFTFLYADLHAHMMDMPLAMLALAWAVSYLLGAARPRRFDESLAVWIVGGLVLGVTRATNTWDFPTYLALGVVAVAAAHWLNDPRLTRANVWGIVWRVGVLIGLALLFYRPYDQWFASPISKADLFLGTKTPLAPYLAIHGLFLFILVTWLVWETRRWMAETPASILRQLAVWLPLTCLAVGALIIGLAVGLYFKIDVALVAVPLLIWAGLLLMRSRAAMPVEKRAVLFLMGTGLALTLFVELFAIGGDRMNTIFKLYIQVWLLFAVAAGAALAWIWAELPTWPAVWRTGWSIMLALMVTGAALYTVTATRAKLQDRFPQNTAQPNGSPGAGCQELPNMPMPYPAGQSLAIKDQPHSLNGLDYMQWSAYCDETYFLPLKYDYEAIRWMQDNVAGSPVIAEAQTFNLYRMSSRYAWNTGLPDVVGWDWHQRQERGAAPTQFITDRGAEVSNFYATLSTPAALDFLKKYDVRYIIVGPMEQAYYLASGGLNKFAQMAAQGQLTLVHENPGVKIYAVPQ